MRYGPAFLAAAFVLSCSHTPQAVSAGYIGDGDYAPAPAVMELLSDHAFVTPGGHAYLYMKRGSGSEKPTLEFFSKPLCDCITHNS